ncbi:AsnC family transcriptional regulator [Rhodobacterales bacterium 52_120_T64]|nr:AsnC family transcriptional regulator [Rhodobacterales bacterium 52_120_T64]
MMANDNINTHILRELSIDGRISNIELAGRVGLSPSACLRRVQELERSGVITGYCARLDPVALGRGFIAFISVGLSVHTKSAQDTFEKAMISAPPVRECHNITGNAEYLLRVEVPDMAAYKNFHTEYLGALPNVASINTSVVLASPKCEPN